MNRDVLHRMKSIRQTVQISSAQKLVAASQVSKAHRYLNESKPYHHHIAQAIAYLLRQCPGLDSGYIETGKQSAARRGLLVVSANHGLTGGYNANVIRFAEQYIKERRPQYIIVLGEACRWNLLKKGYPVDADYTQPLEPPTLFTARELAEKVTAMLENGELDAFNIIYTQYQTSIKMDPVLERLYPLDPDFFIWDGEEREDTIFEPNPERVLASMVLKYLKGFIYGCLVHAWICELTSRVTAMDNAIRNGNELLDKLTLAYNRSRQAAITQEITEIVSGAEALSKD